MNDEQVTDENKQISFFSERSVNKKGKIDPETKHGPRPEMKVLYDSL